MKPIIFAILLIFIFSPCFSQKRYLFSSISLYKEVDQVFLGKRKQARNEYVFNYGAGLNFGYVQKITKKLSFTIQGGFCYFLNNRSNIDGLNRVFRYRNILTPVIGKINFHIIETNKIGLSLGLGGGFAYLQQIKKLADKSVSVYPKWTTVTCVELNFSIKFSRKKRLPERVYAINILKGSYFLIDKKPISSLEFEFHRFTL